MRRDVRVLARATTVAAALAGLWVATGLARAEAAPVLKSVRVEKVALGLAGPPRAVTVRTRPLALAEGDVSALAGSGRGEGIDPATGARVCYDLLYVFDCGSLQRVALHDRFGLAGRMVKSFLAPSPAGYAVLYRYRPDHTYVFLLQKRGVRLALVQTCVFAPPAACVGAASQTLSDHGSVALSFSTRNLTAPAGSFTIAVNRIASGSPGGPGRPGDPGARAGTLLPGMAPQTAAQALAIIRAVMTRNAKPCSLKRWSISVSGFPGMWEAVVTVVRSAGASQAIWTIDQTKLAPTNKLAAAVTAGC